MAKKKKENELIVKENDNILLESRVEANKIKEDLEKYVDEKVNKVFIDELDKVNRKLLREKSKKIFVKNIIIIILLLIIGFLGYLLYSNNYFDRFFNKNNTEIKENIKEETKKDEEEKKEVSKPEKKEPTLDELKKEYGHLLDNYVISHASSYLNDYYNGNLSDNLKQYLTLNTIDFKTISKEDDYNIISSDTFKIVYEKLFDSAYTPLTFDYNGNNIRYVNAMEAYITEKLLNKENTNIKREIKDIKTNDDKIIISTIEGKIIDSKLYNILSDKEIEDYKNDSLLNYGDDLNQVIYTFKNNKLIDLEK